MLEDLLIERRGTPNTVAAYMEGKDMLAIYRRVCLSVV